MTGNLYTDLVCNTTSKFCTPSLDAASVFSLSVASNTVTMLWIGTDSLIRIKGKLSTSTDYSLRSNTGGRPPLSGLPSVPCNIFW
ncbi:hypothetical protein ARMGADRAFT_787947 [Armillaria gallica]|uniref:Uncharacterized protein n=1 Tax=Armillaria gallica TaxID=47427 RepID=A0A2H3E662_ARMGA|nr:hypothetical protein ARMGADRAFT_787947 [Armillaria gallica]